MYSRILVPTDFSENSDGALAYAVALASQFKAALHLIHVCQPPVLATGTVDSLVVSVTDWEAELRAAAEKAMTETVGRLPGVAVSTEVAIGSPPACIVASAAEHGVDLIVMGTHGRRGIKRLALGSDAEMVLRSAPVPVLMVRET